MIKYIFYFLFFQLSFSQSNSALETKINNAIDVFVANPTQKNLVNLEKSEKLFQPKTSAEKLAFVILKCNKAYYQNQFGQTKNAISSYEIAWQLFDKNKLTNYDISESCLKPLGNLYTIIGDYDNAENTIKQYFYIANLENNTTLKYAAIVNLSNVYQNTGKVDDAIDLLQKTIKNEVLSQTQKGILYANLGANYVVRKSGKSSESNDLKNAEIAFQKSIVLLQDDKSQLESISNSYRNLSKLYAPTNLDLSLYYFEKAKTAFAKTNTQEIRKKAQFFLEEAALLFQKNEIATAQNKVTETIHLLLPNYQKNKNELYAETILLDAFDLQAALFLSNNKLQEALSSYKSAFVVENLLSALLVHENSKIISQISIRNRTEKCIEIYLSLFQKDKKTSHIEHAFLLQEQSKSAVLSQALFDKKNQSEAEKSILKQLQSENLLIIKEQKKGNLADISIINNALKRTSELTLLLKSKKTNVTKISSNFNIANLYLKLNEDKATLIEYFYGAEKIYVFTIEKGKIKLEIVATDEVARPKITSFLALFSDSEKITNNVSNYLQEAFDCYKLLKLPQKSASKNLIIVPDGLLSFLPFEALIAKKTTTTNFAIMPYLLTDFVVGYSNSANFYLNSNSLNNKSESVLGVFPIFENTDFELTFSEKELQNLKQNYDGIFLEKDQATFSNFKKNAKKYSILHLSTHASSGDIYNQASIRFYDSEIVYSELYNLDFNPDLVVLSACETGLGKLYKSEGAMSVARGFQFAGAQNLLFSLWKVNDYTTSVFMKDFYKNNNKFYNYLEANHQAKLDFLANSDLSNSKKSPYYWSAFVYYGAITKAHDSSNNLLWISISVALFFLVYYYRFIKK